MAGGCVRSVNKPARLMGKEFRFLRVMLKLSQAAMAKMQGVSEQNVSLWERHGKVPKANDKLMRCFYKAYESKNQRPINSAGPEVSAPVRPAVQDGGSPA
jgi:DNA-binding transcriptional regulator YiaG